MNLAEAGRLAIQLAGELPDPQRDLPRIAREPSLCAGLNALAVRLATEHHLLDGDSRDLGRIPDGSVHLIVTSPPYWTLKRYNDVPGQLGHVADYGEFLELLDDVWRECQRVLVPGGRLVIVVGDVCLSRRMNHGRHTVVPLHAAIAERCFAIGFDGLAPIIWHKIANAVFEAQGNGAGFLGKPYEPNAVIKNDIEYLLMQRKPGGYRSPDLGTRLLSLIPGKDHKLWFRQIWTDIRGASTRAHPAPYPLDLASRLIRMFSFAGDTVLDPFGGIGTTSLASALTGRSSITVDIDASYLDIAASRLRPVMPETATLHRGPLADYEGDHSSEAA